VDYGTHSTRYHPSDNVCVNLPRKVDISELLLGREHYLVQLFKEVVLIASRDEIRKSYELGYSRGPYWDIAELQMAYGNDE
jgi:hypothetical protein